MKLYLLTTKSLGDFYVVSTDPTSAENKLSRLLSEANYGFLGDRIVINITLLAKEVELFAGKPHFSSKDALILPSTCELLK